MNNTTSVDGNGGGRFESAWVAAQICNSLFAVVCVWSTLAFCSYARRKKKLRLMRLALLTPCIILVRIAADQSVILIGLVQEAGESGDLACEIAVDLSGIVFFVSGAQTYLYFWMRLRILYAQPSLKRMRSRAISVLMYLALTPIICAPFLCFFYAAPTSFRLDPAVGCIRREAKASRVVELVRQVTFSSTVFSQFVMFLLFVYPLVLHKGTSTTAMTGKRGESRTARRVRGAIRQASIGMSICTLSYLFTMVCVSAVLPDKVPRTITSHIYEFNMIVNLLSVMISFERCGDLMLFGRFSSSSSVTAKNGAVATTDRSETAGSNSRSTYL